MTVANNTAKRADGDEQETCDCESGSSWAGELGFPILLIAIAISAYGCNMAADLKSKSEAYADCAKAKEITESCRLILQYGR